MTMHVGTNLLYEFLSTHARLCSGIKQKGQERIWSQNLIADLECQERKACQSISRYWIDYILRINNLSDEDTWQGIIVLDTITKLLVNIIISIWRSRYIVENNCTTICDDEKTGWEAWLWSRKEKWSFGFQVDAHCWYKQILTWRWYDREKEYNEN